MLREIRPAIVVLVALTLITGLVYPLAMTGIAQILFPNQAQGSLIERDGHVVGSALIGQDFTSDKYFHGRPSATTAADPNDLTKTVPAPYNAANSGGSNLGPSNKALIDRVQADLDKLKKENPSAAGPRRPGHDFGQRTRSQYLGSSRLLPGSPCCQGAQLGGKSSASARQRSRRRSVSRAFGRAARQRSAAQSRARPLIAPAKAAARRNVETLKWRRRINGGIPNIGLRRKPCLQRHAAKKAGLASSESLSARLRASARHTRCCNRPMPAEKTGTMSLSVSSKPTAARETEALLEGLEVVPRRRVEYKGQSLEEMDLDAIIARRPQIVLVDELAHTNAEGSRHPKRYLDVEELMGRGIDVYTTVNIQHIESLNDVVAQITHVRVRETVPDAVFDRADAVELVDLTPDDLIQRLQGGKGLRSPAGGARARAFLFSGKPDRAARACVAPHCRPGR